MELTKLQNSKDDTNKKVFQRLLRYHLKAKFDLLEGTIYSIKQVLHKIALFKQIELSQKEINFLLEEKHLEKDGSIKVKKINIYLVRNIKFTIGMIEKILHCTLDGKRMYEPGWINLEEVKEIRNRITHPKKIADLIINKEEIEKITDVLAWCTFFIDKIIDILRDTTI